MQVAGGVVKATDSRQRGRARGAAGAAWRLGGSRYLGPAHLTTRTSRRPRQKPADKIEALRR